jgi:hypothetical protein
MNNQIKEYRNKANDIFEDIGKFACYTRGIEFQKDSIVKLTAFKEDVISEKELAAKSNDNDLANAFASFEFVTEAMISEFKMWIELKEENYNSAWDSLVDAQSYASMSMQAHETNGHLENYIRRLEVLEKVLFPPQLFFSDRSVISESTCSICGKSMDDCEHIKGKFYLGKQCYEVIKKIETIYAYDIVKDPANKKCRALTFSENGNDTDLMTYRQNDFG